VNYNGQSDPRHSSPGKDLSDQRSVLCDDLRLPSSARRRHPGTSGRPVKVAGRSTGPHEDWQVYGDFTLPPAG
jgi:hypothetical protein